MKRREPWALSQRTLYRIYFSCGAPECQGEFCVFPEFLRPFRGKTTAFSLTMPARHDRIAPHAGMVELGSDANAACGGGSELSAWPRSKFYERTASEKFRAPQQEDAVDLGSPATEYLLVKNITEYAGMVELVDSVDLGSIA